MATNLAGGRWLTTARQRQPFLSRADTYAAFPSAKRRDGGHRVALLTRMPAFIVQRLFQAGLVLLAVAFIAFMLFQYVVDPRLHPVRAGGH